ncbi:hypothetical protein JNK62_01855 [bacterium]|nr:hypothetical protein [bacterium]
MKKHETTFMYIGFAAIGLLLVGLAGWYFFISRQTADLETLRESRGFDIGVPSFGGTRGSTAENIEGGFGLAPSSEQPSAQEGEEPRAPRFWRVSTSPIAGAGFVMIDSVPVLRYVERSTGHVFDVNPMTGTITRRTNRLIPKVYEAIVGPHDAVIHRTITADGERETFVGQLATTTVDGFTPLTGTDLGPDVRDIGFTKSGIVFLSATESGATQLIEAAIDGSKPVEKRLLSAGDFKLESLVDGRTILTERPASGIPGYAYEAGTTLIPLARAVPGLTLAARASSTAVIIGADDGSKLSLAVRPTRDASLVPLDLATVADKCVWMPGTSLTAYCAVPRTLQPLGYLTNWHRGTIHTSDSWHLVDVGAGKTEKFFEIREDDAIDVERPITDEGGNYIAFINARDKSLWLLRIIE